MVFGTEADWTFGTFEGDLLERVDHLAGASGVRMRDRRAKRLDGAAGTGHRPARLSDIMLP